MGKSAFFLGAAAFLLLPAISPPEEDAARKLAGAEAQYVALQAGLFDGRLLTASPDDAATIERFLRDIRSGFPDVKDIGLPPAWTEKTSLIVGLQRSFEPQLALLCRAEKDYAKVHSETVGIAEIDAVTRQLGGSYELTCRNQRPTLGAYAAVNFPRLLHPPSLIRLYQAIPAVASAENNLVIFGGVIPVVVAKEMGQWRVTFGRGSGDCPAGCTKKEYFTFIVAADFSIQYVGTEKNGSGANVQ